MLAPLPWDRCLGEQCDGSTQGSTVAVWSRHTLPDGIDPCARGGGTMSVSDSTRSSAPWRISAVASPVLVVALFILMIGSLTPRPLSSAGYRHSAHSDDHATVWQHRALFRCTVGGGRDRPAAPHSGSHAVGNGARARGRGDAGRISQSPRRAGDCRRDVRRRIWRCRWHPVRLVGLGHRGFGFCDGASWHWRSPSASRV